MSALATDEIYEHYLQKAISEVNELGDEIDAEADPPARARVGPPARGRLPAEVPPAALGGAGGSRVLRPRGAGDPEVAAAARVDPMASTARTASSSPTRRGESAPWLARELHIVEPKLVVCMGEEALGSSTRSTSRSRARSSRRSGELQTLRRRGGADTPDIDASLDEQPAKTRFWNAFKTLGPWWAELPPY